MTGRSQQQQQQLTAINEKKAMAMWSLLVSVLSLSHSMVLLLTGQWPMSQYSLLLEPKRGGRWMYMCASSLTNSNTEHPRTPLEERKKNQ